MFAFVGLTIAIMRGFTDLKYLERSWEADKVCCVLSLFIVMQLELL